MKVELSKNKMRTIKWMCDHLLEKESITGNHMKRIQSVQRMMTSLLKDADKPKLSSDLLPSAKDDLKKLLGVFPYNSGVNYLMGDPYFAMSLEKKYGLTIDELRKECNLY